MELPTPASARGNDSSQNGNDDNWSRQVETDESVQQRPLDQSSLAAHQGGLVSPMATMPPTPSSTRAVHDVDLTDTGSIASAAGTRTGLAPERTEPTLKEKLVERERQRRVETERARLKHRFVLSGNTGDATDDDRRDLNDEEENIDDNSLNANDDASTDGMKPDGSRGNDDMNIGSVEDKGTGITAQGIEQSETPETKLPYPMERFLQDQGDSEKKTEPLEQGVVMERFLHEAANVSAPDPQPTGPSRAPIEERSVSFDVDPQTPEPAQTVHALEDRQESHLKDDNDVDIIGSDGPLDRKHRHFSSSGSTDILGSVASMEVNASVDANASVGDEMMDSVDDNEDVPTDHTIQVSSGTRPDSPSSIGQSPISEQPLVLRLTEAEIQQMAAIDEASRSNAPPSERDSISESSFVGELIGDFGGPNVDTAGNLSQGTPVTAMDSSSAVSENHSATPLANGMVDIQSSNGNSQHSRISSTGGNISVTANPPSVVSPQESPVPEEVGPVQTTIPNEILSLHQIADGNGKMDPPAPLARSEVPTELIVGAAANEGIVNRKMRPGMVKSIANQGASSSDDDDVVYDTKMPAMGAKPPPGNVDTELVVDYFEFNKHDSTTPTGDFSDSFRDLPPDDVWSPQGKMFVSPLNDTRKTPSSSTLMASNLGVGSKPDYGSTALNNNQTRDIRGISPDDTEYFSAANGDHEAQPLLDHVPKEVLARRTSRGRVSILSMDKASINMTIDDIFSEIRSQSTATLEAGSNEANEYMKTNILQRAFPERMIALTVTMVIEIPVLLMVSGGSDRLCMLIGRSKYQLLMGFLPLSSAISGNVGLQASTLTTRAISHGHVTRELYRPWLMKEIGAAVFLGVGMGFLIGSIAFLASGYDIAFGVTVLVAQFVSIVTAGCTGTLAPLVFSFIFERDAGKWGGPLETAVQDIIGSFAMVVMSYKLLDMLGPLPIDPNDVCG